MIPKKIHYFWFGNGPLPELTLKCIESWKKHCPDYEIYLWNEGNIDLKQNKFSYEAYKAKKYGFAADYFRLKVLYENGGVYLDTDVEVIRNLDPLLSNEGFFGFQDHDYINTGSGFGACKNNPILLDLMRSYENASFFNEDGSQNLTPSPVKDTSVLVAHGLQQNNTLQVINGIKFLPTEYLCPIDFMTGRKKITDNTYAIHHFMGSWLNDRDKRRLKIIRLLNRVFGKDCTDIVFRCLRKIKRTYFYLLCAK